MPVKLKVIHFASCSVRCRALSIVKQEVLLKNIQEASSCRSLLVRAQLGAALTRDKIWGPEARELPEPKLSSTVLQPLWPNSAQVAKLSPGVRVAYLTDTA